MPTDLKTMDDRLDRTRYFSSGNTSRTVHKQQIYQNLFETVEEVAECLPAKYMHKTQKHPFHQAIA